jgi:hypothetical protein
MGKSTPIGGSLSDARAIMAILHVLTVKLLCQVVMGRVPVLECRLPVAHGCLWLHPVMSGFKWHCFPRTQLQRLYLVLERPSDITVEGPSAF